MEKIKEKYYNIGNKGNKKYKFLVMLALENKNLLAEYCKGDILMEQYDKELKEINDNDYIVPIFITPEEDEKKLRNTTRILAEMKGKQEEKMHIAKEMLKMNLDVNIISKATGLSVEEIEKI